MAAPASRQPPAPGTVVLAIDPGREKCGIAVVRLASAEIEILWHAIVPARDMDSSLPAQIARYAVDHLIVGDATGSRDLCEQLGQWLPTIPFALVEEKNSTLEARALYWREHPPRGWRRLLPLSLQAPPEPIDDFAAIILAQRYLGTG
jgi:RNase H-fold protein (predicted Holliday junction resolvase)